MSQSNPLAPLINPQPAAAGLDMVARAEAALKALAGQFALWLQDEIDKLDAARALVAAEGLAGEAGETLHRTAHDLKGLGGTYEFPIVGRIAGSLCTLLTAQERRASQPLDLIDAHIDAIKRMVREEIRDDRNPIAAALAASLERRVEALDA